MMDGVADMMGGVADTAGVRLTMRVCGQQGPTLESLFTYYLPQRNKTHELPNPRLKVDLG